MCEVHAVGGGHGVRGECFLLMDRCGGEGSYGEMLLLAAIHFQEKRRGQIMEMVSGTLGFSLQVGGAQGTPPGNSS